jgi:hypothetical protein
MTETTKQEQAEATEAKKTADAITGGSVRQAKRVEETQGSSGSGAITGDKASEAKRTTSKAKAAKQAAEAKKPVQPSTEVQEGLDRLRSLAEEIAAVDEKRSERNQLIRKLLAQNAPRKEVREASNLTQVAFSHIAKA